MISDIVFQIGLYLPNRTCIAFSSTSKFYCKLFTSDSFWNTKLRHDIRFEEKTYLSYITYQREKSFLNYKAHLHVISTDNCDQALLSSLIQYTLYNRIHPWLYKQLVSINDGRIKRGDIVSLSNIDIDDSCKYIYSGSYLEPLSIHRDGSMILPNRYSTITEFPIYYWSKILSHSYVPFNVYSSTFDIFHMKSYSYLQCSSNAPSDPGGSLRCNFRHSIQTKRNKYYIIVGMESDKFKKIISSNSLLSFLDSCYYSYKDPYPEIPKIKTGRRRTLYVIWNGK